jgi:uncharacterized protein YbjT (DUF2867 family)
MQLRREVRVRALVTGVSGWAGHDVALALRAAGHEVVGLSRDPARAHIDVPVVRGDAATGEGLGDALDGAQVAYYFVHSLESANEEGYAARDRRAAANFAEAARAAGVERVLFLGVILPGGELSDHLRSRLDVEEILRGATPASLSLRASMVIGARSPGFRFMVRMVERLPAIARTPASAHLWQPIDARDVASCMVAAATWPDAAGQAIDIAGPDVVPLGQVTELVAEALGVEREIVDAPAIEPALAARELCKITGDDPAYMQPLMETLNTGDLVARHDGPAMLGAPARYGVREAVRHAVAEHTAVTGRT